MAYGQTVEFGVEPIEPERVLDVLLGETVEHVEHSGGAWTFVLASGVAVQFRPGFRAEPDAANPISEEQAHALAASAHIFVLVGGQTEAPGLREDEYERGVTG